MKDFLTNKVGLFEDRLSCQDLTKILTYPIRYLAKRMFLFFFFAKGRCESICTGTVADDYKVYIPKIAETWAAAFFDGDQPRAPAVWPRNFNIGQAGEHARDNISWGHAALSKIKRNHKPYFTGEEGVALNPFIISTIYWNMVINRDAPHFRTNRDMTWYYTFTICWYLLSIWLWLDHPSCVADHPPHPTDDSDGRCGICPSRATRPWRVSPWKAPAVEDRESMGVHGEGIMGLKQDKPSMWLVYKEINQHKLFLFAGTLRNCLRT